MNKLIQILNKLADKNLWSIVLIACVLSSFVAVKYRDQISSILSIVGLEASESKAFNDLSEEVESMKKGVDSTSKIAIDNRDLFVPANRKMIEDLSVRLVKVELRLQEAEDVIDRHDVVVTFVNGFFANFVYQIAVKISEFDTLTDKEKSKFFNNRANRDFIRTLCRDPDYRDVLAFKNRGLTKKFDSYDFKDNFKQVCTYYDKLTTDSSLEISNDEPLFGKVDSKKKKKRKKRRYAANRRES